MTPEQKVEALIDSAALMKIFAPPAQKQEWENARLSANALNAVLARHRRAVLKGWRRLLMLHPDQTTWGARGNGYCPACAQTWPCATYRIIEAELHEYRLTP